ncbi:MAG TPA: hypothetical protein VJ464_02010 [Blastocatellia bacterium]|nr:hypothetical protein [Blastocatellia bacterium]
MSITQINEEEWQKGDYRPAAMIRRTVEDVTKQFGITFLNIHEDGLGAAKLAGVKTAQGQQFLLEQFFDGPEPTEDTIHIFCLYDEAMTSHLEEILEALEVRWSEILWTDQRIRFQEHEVWREDDNGNRFLVEVTPNRAEAAMIEKRLTGLGHKQVYWIEGRSRES